MAEERIRVRFIKGTKATIGAEAEYRKEVAERLLARGSVERVEKKTIVVVPETAPGKRG